jgi:hypothetical protein
MQIVDMFTKSSETALESARKITELNLRSFDILFQRQAELAAFYMDAGTRGMELFTKAKGYEDLLAGQTALAREFSERGLAAVRTGVSDMQTVGGELGTLVQEGFKLAQEQATQVAGMTMKAAV